MSDDRDGDHDDRRTSPPTPADSPNLATLWGRSVVDELARLDVPVVYAPGSRSTPLVVAACRHPDATTYRHLDERSAGFLALGWARRRGRPAAVVTTSGTATANLHPAVMEADRARVPLLLLTADRPADLRDSGANQTADQERLYGDAVRWSRDLPEPTPRERSLRRVRTDVARAVGVAAGAGGAPGPVHVNAPFRKPLDPLPPSEAPRGAPVDAVPETFLADATAAVEGRDDGTPFVRWWTGAPEPGNRAVADLATAVERTERGLIVVGPADAPPLDGERLAALSAATGYPLLADPLSNLRYGRAVDRAPVCGGYDTYLDSRVTAGWPDPDLVLGAGASPTSKPLRTYLARVDARRVQVDPAGDWREATFTSTDQVVAAPDALADALLDRLSVERATDWTERWLAAEDAHREAVAAARAGEVTVEVDGERVTPSGDDVEGPAVATAVEAAPEGATLFVSNSTPVRDLDRFVPPSVRSLTVHGNRGVSGIDGVTSTAAGATMAGDGPGLLVTGDLAWLHDTNGQLALRDHGVDLTAVVVDNDGGGVFHGLPIEQVDPPFTEAFRTPHGLDFSGTAATFEVDYREVAPTALGEACAEAVGNGEPTVLTAAFDARLSHRVREAVVERVAARLRTGE
jgi:2-succinyl-5-enolpyruvyl-6-hydroxy-3-cyclohexene-1-carboxylate synthase